MNQNQKELFDLQPELWELDDQAEQSVAEVVFAEGLPGPLDYAIPPALHGQLQPGKRVRVPLGRGNRLVTGYCVGVEYRAVAARRLKEVVEVIDQQALVSPAMLRLTRWMADHYLSSWGKVLEAVVPAGVRGQAGTREQLFLSVPTAVAAKLAGMKLPPKQALALKILAASSQPLTPQQLAAAARCTMGPINSLRKKRLVRDEMRRIQQADITEPPQEEAAEVQLNADQQTAVDAALQALRAGRHETLLLHGVTGSGKTEVYMRTIEEVIRFGRQAIVLVPEISLTPQTQRRFHARFRNVAVLHSHLSDGERHWHWRRIASGQVPVVVGARSAIFAPTPHLGLIILDEEHDGSFKQDQVPRYHARDVAVKRAEAESIPLILGSATPSLESWHQAQQGNYRLLAMPQRVLDLPLPDVVTVDLRNEARKRYGHGAVSQPLHQAMDQALRAGGQVILLLNRRGFSTHIQCPACGLVVKCPDCDIALTHHREGEKAICHYCDYEAAAPAVCPKCRFEGIRYGGFGTQRLEAEVRARFRDVPCLRMDSDTMQRPGSHERALARFRAGEIKILLGTQMIAKGLDFPNVTLVGVINADTALHLPDFRAAERTFQLVTQVAGRTGRSEQGGRVLVQTFNPDHPSVLAAQRHDFHQFAAQELPARQAFGYPPFGAVIRLIIRGPLEGETQATAESLVANVRQFLPDDDQQIRVLGPAPAPIAKLRGKFRFHVLLQGPDRDVLRQAVAQTQQKLIVPEQVQWVVDVDPLDML